MGLNDLADTGNRVEVVNDTEQVMPGDIETRVVSTDEFGRVKEIDDGFEIIVLDLLSDTKLCPSCGCKSYRHKGENWHVCPNMECGVLRFKEDWHENRSKGKFLGSFKIQGWEYTHE